MTGVSNIVAVIGFSGFLAVLAESAPAGFFFVGVLAARFVVGFEEGLDFLARVSGFGENAELGIARVFERLAKEPLGDVRVLVAISRNYRHRAFL